MTHAQHSERSPALALDSAQAVLLDMDGTLVLSEDVHRRSWQALFDARALTVSDSEYEQRYMGRRPADVLPGLPGPSSDSRIKQAVAEMTDFILGQAHTVPVVPGAAELIRRLHAQGIPMAVVTSAGAVWAERILDGALNVRSLINIVVTSEQVRHGKPSPDGYLTACRALGVAPDRCMAFEDSPSGIRALTKAGVRDIVGVTTTTTAADLVQAGACWTTSNLVHEAAGQASPAPQKPPVPPVNDQESTRP
ncbi:HAD family phosphatase [Streptomyces sp. WAC 05379]|uniref:HAD family hydrolase n=1 Tax=Streptomyces sp. WAC 05379 TaxID=2203207 RepID=UPI00163C0EFC|nr:HAD family phosphatase [Streptomyces sp. WAC 05379]